MCACMREVCWCPLRPEKSDEFLGLGFWTDGSPLTLVLESEFSPALEQQVLLKAEPASVLASNFQTQKQSNYLRTTFFANFTTDILGRYHFEVDF